MISKISDAEQTLEDLFDLQNLRDEVEQEAQMEPYIMNLRNPWDGEMKWELEDPAPHQVFFYNQRIEELAEDLGVDVDNNELIPDGGYSIPENYDQGLYELAESVNELEW